MARWPWVTTIVAPLIALTPLARDLFYSAFISSDRWMQDLMQLIYGAGIAIAILLGFIEWGIRVVLIRRRVRLAVVTGERTTES
jgi:hypothetical protein